MSLGMFPDVSKDCSVLALESREFFEEKLLDTWE
jgi:hypothetical protein